MYEYRFSENRIERYPYNCIPNSAESSSPPPWESAGSSPEYLAGVCRTSPVITYYDSPIRSALKSSSSGRPRSRKAAKSVQWVSDIKKKPQDISHDRKIVKVQVIDIETGATFKRL